MLVQVSSFMRSGTLRRVSWEGLGPAPKGPLGILAGHMDGWMLGTTFWDNHEDVSQSPPVFNCPCHVSTMFATAEEASCGCEFLDLESEFVCNHSAEADDDSPLVGVEPEVKAEAPKAEAESLESKPTHIPAFFPQSKTESLLEPPMSINHPETPRGLSDGREAEGTPEVCLGLCLYPLASRPCAIHICCVVILITMYM